MMDSSRYEKLIEGIKTGDNNAVVEIIEYLYNNSVNCEINVRKALGVAGQARKIAEELKDGK